MAPTNDKQDLLSVLKSPEHMHMRRRIFWIIVGVPLALIAKR